MAHKKTTSRPVPRKASRALRNKGTSKTTKSLAGSALSQNPGKHRSGKTRSAVGRFKASMHSARDKDIASPKSASQIRKDVGVTKRDRATARRAARRYD